MKSTLKTFSIILIIGWLFVIGTFILVGFFTSTLLGIPFLVAIKDFLGLTRDSLENLLVTMVIILVPLTILVFKMDQSYNVFGMEKKVKVSKSKLPVEEKKAEIKKDIPKVTATAHKVTEVKPQELEVKYVEIGLTKLKLKV
jgi:hypothetical protein